MLIKLIMDSDKAYDLKCNLVGGLIYLPTPYLKGFAFVPECNDKYDIQGKPLSPYLTIKQLQIY